MCFIILADFYQPFKEDELEQSTEVQIIFPVEPKPVSYKMWWKKNWCIWWFGYRWIYVYIQSVMLIGVGII